MPVNRTFTGRSALSFWKRLRQWMIDFDGLGRTVASGLSLTGQIEEVAYPALYWTHDVRSHWGSRWAFDQCDLLAVPAVAGVTCHGRCLLDLANETRPLEMVQPDRRPRLDVIAGDNSLLYVSSLPEYGQRIRHARCPIA